MANTETLRQQNRALTLAALRARGSMAHTDISDWTGLSSATVSAITNELLSERILMKSESAAPSGRGRPRVLLKHNPDAAYIAAIRITSDEVEYSLADYSGTLKDRFSVKRLSSGTETEQFAEQFRESLQRLLERSDIARSQLMTVSVTSKGLVASNGAVLLWSPVFGSNQVDFKALLGPDWNALVKLTNETQFAAEALAKRMISEKPQFGVRKSATLSLDHSIGLGIATEEGGQVVHSEAPSFSHMAHSVGGPLCRCGAKGCIEAYAGFYGILRTAFEVPIETIPARFLPLTEIDKLADTARRGDRMARYAFRQAGEVLGTGVSRLISIYGPMPLTITGQGLRYFDLMQESFLEPLHDNLQTRIKGMPDISVHDDQANLIYEGNIDSSLSHLDSNVLAVKRMREGV